MRTTLDIDDDVLQAVKELAQVRGTTAGKVISDLARKGLAPAQAGPPVSRNGVPVLSPRGPEAPRITRQHLDTLRDDA